jgi:MFS family permease
VPARPHDRWEPWRLVRTGVALIVVGLGGMVVILQTSVPVPFAVAAWTVAGLGMGLAYAPTSLLVLRHAPAGREGWASAALNLTEVLGTALGVGLGGAAVAAAARAGWSVGTGATLAFLVAGAGAAMELVVSRRLIPARTAPAAGLVVTRPLT